MLTRARHRFLADCRSVAGLEFALILPLMLGLLGGVYDLSEAIIVYSQVNNAAQSMAASASSLAVRTDGQTALYYDQVQLVESQIWADVPSLANGSKSGNPKSVTLSSVFFYPVSGTSCNSTDTANTPCNFVAYIAWSVAYAGSGFTTNLPSDCVSSTQISTVSQNQVSATTALPNVLNDFPTATISTGANWSKLSNGDYQNAAGISPILAITIQYTYTPLFTIPLKWRGVTNFVLGQFTFYATGYWPVRSVSNVQATSSTGATTPIYANIPPLANQFTQIYGNSSTQLVSSTGATVSTGSSWCVNTVPGGNNESAITAVPPAT